MPALTAIWWVPWFITQDGPAHLYNSHIIERSFDPDSPFRDYYRVRWEPFPNWTGHLAMVGLLKLLPEARLADRVMTSATLVGFAASILWLRWRVAGWRGMPAAGLLAAILSLNVTWLLGFTSFLLGACLLPITLGVWWGYRDRFGPKRIAMLWFLVTLGYFSHLVSLGLTVAGLAILALGSPRESRWARVKGTAFGLIPLIPLGTMYVVLSRQGGRMQPQWQFLTPPLVPRAWFKQLGWVDPISLASKVILPFLDSPSLGWACLTPVLWVAIALVLASASTRWNLRSDDRRGWAILAVLLMLGGLLGPDTLGASHGHYLPQRIVLFGLVALVPFLNLELKGWTSIGCVVALTLAVTVQSGFVWEYAVASNNVAIDVMSAKGAVGKGKRIATLLTRTRGRFRANPVLHADNLLGVDTGNIIWSNYETRYYYFPVQFLKDEGKRPGAADLEWIALHDMPMDAEERVSRWASLIETHLDEIDLVVTWGDDTEFVRVNRRWFDDPVVLGQVRILRKRDEPAGGLRRGSTTGTIKPPDIKLE